MVLGRHEQIDAVVGFRDHLEPARGELVDPLISRSEVSGDGDRLARVQAPVVEPVDQHLQRPRHQLAEHGLDHEDVARALEDEVDHLVRVVAVVQDRDEQAQVERAVRVSPRVHGVAIGGERAAEHARSKTSPIVDVVEVQVLDLHVHHDAQLPGHRGVSTPVVEESSSLSRHVVIARIVDELGQVLRSLGQPDVAEVVVQADEFSDLPNRLRLRRRIADDVDHLADDRGAELSAGGEGARTGLVFFEFGEGERERELGSSPRVDAAPKVPAHAGVGPLGAFKIWRHGSSGVIGNWIKVEKATDVNPWKRRRAAKDRQTL